MTLAEVLAEKAAEERDAVVQALFEPYFRGYVSDGEAPRRDRDPRADAR